MIPDAPEVVETSSNLSIVRTSEGLVEIQILVRSSSETMKMALASELESTFALAGARVEFDGAYPGWEPNVQIGYIEPDEKNISASYRKRGRRKNDACRIGVWYYPELIIRDWI